MTIKTIPFKENDSKTQKKTSLGCLIFKLLIQLSVFIFISVAHFLISK